MLDILIVGAGPAGLAIAQAAHQRGLKVSVMAPNLTSPWPQTFSAWLDELVDVPLTARWRSVAVRGTGDRRRFDQSYGLVDNDALQAQLIAGLRLIDQRAVEVSHNADYSVVNGVCARLVVDASGHQPALLSPSPGRPAGWQTAFGRMLKGRHGMPLDTAVLMDFHADGPPTFLYALPLSEDRVFVEETSLIGARPPAFEFLRDRLDERLDRLGLRGETVGMERCLFPMGTPLPQPQRVVGFGAAAGMVHPATGYSVGRTLRAAARVAAALDPELPPDEAADQAWSAVWPQHAKRARAWHVLGGHILDQLDAHQTRAFFDAFFGLPEATWRSYLDADQPPTDAMLQLFASADNRVRLTLVAAGFSAVRAA